MRKLLLALFFCLLFFSAPSLVTAEEINRFDVSIWVDKDGSLRVQEQINYDFGYSTDRHGIYREIPFIKENQTGVKFKLDFANFQVNFPFSRETINNHWKLKIGDPDKTVIGRKTYVIEYTVRGALTYFSDHDELYWNVTGNGWNVPINQASAIIYLPQAIVLDKAKLTCYTGRFGSQNQNCTGYAQEEDRYLFQASKLDVNEGLTVVMGFPKGIAAVVEPKPYVTFWETKLGQLVALILKTLLLLGATFWYLVYPAQIIIKWFKYGRDPKSPVGQATAWFSPPKVGSHELTPAEVGTLVDERVQIKDILAMVVDLARRGFYKIEERKKNDWYLIRQKDSESAGLSGYEKKWLEDLFSSSSEIRLKTKKLYTAFETINKNLYERVVELGLFPKNPQSIRLFYGVMMALSLMSANLFLFVVCWLFGMQMPRKTEAGAAAANMAKALRNFLVSQDRQLAFQADKQLLFEKLLPYAIAFGVEKIWAKRFANLNLKPPDWYQGYGQSHFNSTLLASNLNRSFTSMRAAMTPTSSSSGFSSGFSGGSSGGGGGGGGGGSWVILLTATLLLNNTPGVFRTVVAQEVGSSTKEVLENVSTRQKPQAVQMEEEQCKILGIFNCLQPKVDYVHEDRLPETQQIQDKGLSFWQSIGNFITGLFNKSSKKETGYGFTYLPQGVNPVGEIADPNVGGLSLESATELTHSTVEKSYLPYSLQGRITPEPTLLASLPTVTPSLLTVTPGDAVPPAAGGSTVEFARSLYETAVKACGKTSGTNNTKTLTGTYGDLPKDKDAARITCLNGKVNSDVYLDLKASADGNSWLQCVGFVIGVEQSQGKTLASRNAKDYCSGSVPSGYVRINKNQIAPGDVVANIEPPWGHIMTVLEVYAGSGTYKVAEANWEVSGSIQITRIIYGADIDCVLRRK